MSAVPGEVQLDAFIDSGEISAAIAMLASDAVAGTLQITVVQSRKPYPSSIPGLG